MSPYQALSILLIAGFTVELYTDTLVRRKVGEKTYATTGLEFLTDYGFVKVYELQGEIYVDCAQVRTEFHIGVWTLLRRFRTPLEAAQHLSEFRAAVASRPGVTADEEMMS